MDMPPPTEPLLGLIFDIRGYALHDGPGLRSTVFFKGCPLHCLWCSNPESHVQRPDLVWLKERCLACDQCLPACPRGALGRDPEGGRQLDAERCDQCGACAEQCPREALNLMGRWLTVTEVLAEASGGGLTLSGGEPLAQADFAAELLRRCKHEETGRHTVVETSGAVPWHHFQKVADDVDLFLYDLKHMDPDEHLRLTGRSNEQILENAVQLAQEGRPMVIRVPLIPGVNDTKANLAATAAFVQSLPGVERIDLLPHRRPGGAERRRMGRANPLAASPAFGPDRTAWAKAFLEQRGFQVRVGG